MVCVVAAGVGGAYMGDVVDEIAECEWRGAWGHTCAPECTAQAADEGSTDAARMAKANGWQAMSSELVAAEGANGVRQ